MRRRFRKPRAGPAQDTEKEESLASKAHQQRFPNPRNGRRNSSIIPTYFLGEMEMGRGGARAMENSVCRNFFSFFNSFFPKLQKIPSSLFINPLSPGFSNIRHGFINLRRSGAGRMRMKLEVEMEMCSPRGSPRGHSLEETKGVGRVLSLSLSLLRALLSKHLELDHGVLAPGDMFIAIHVDDHLSLAGLPLGWTSQPQPRFRMIDLGDILVHKSIYQCVIGSLM